MYLSKVTMDREAFLNPYEWHRALWQLFPGKTDEARDFLFRVEQTSHETNAVVLLQSESMPQLEGQQVHVIAGPKLIALNSITSGRQFRFRLVANVTKKIKDSNNPDRSIRVPLLKEEERIAWLTRKLDSSAILLETQVLPNPSLHFKKQGKAGKLITATFEGILQVTDPTGLLKLIANGIGPAKGFGCGLLSLAPAF